MFAKRQQSDLGQKRSIATTNELRVLRRWRPSKYDSLQHLMLGRCAQDNLPAAGDEDYPCAWPTGRHRKAMGSSGRMSAVAALAAVRLPANVFEVLPRGCVRHVGDDRRFSLLVFGGSLLLTS